MPEVDREGLRLYYTESGEGPPVLWHTGGCGDGTMWETAGYVSALPGYRHILFDQRGHGRSGAPEGMVGHHMSEYVEDVIAVLDHAGAEQAAMVGYSAGARVAYATAIRHPGRLGAIVGLDSVPTPDEDPGEIREEAEQVLTGGTRAAIEAMAAEESELPPAWLLDHLCGTSDESFAGAYESFATAVELWRHLPAVATPTLFLVGIGEGEEERRAEAEALASSMPNGRVAVLDGLGHIQAFWRTDRSLPPIRDFLAEAWPR